MAMGTRIILFMVAFNVFLLLFSLSSDTSILTTFGITYDPVTQSTTFDIFNMNILFGGILLVGSIITTFATALVNRDSSFLYTIPSIVLFIGMTVMPLATLITIGIPASLVLLFGGIWTIMFILAIINFIRGGDF